MLPRSDSLVFSKISMVAELAFGRCRLTGNNGTFVKCHLLPKSLTSPPDRSEVRVEGGEGRRPIARYDGWYDKNIVTRRGEDVFQALDDHAIAELRRLKLVWSSWDPQTDTCPIQCEPLQGEWGVRTVQFLKPDQMRLFALSLLWRAATSSVPGFADIELPSDRLDLIAQMLNSSSQEPLHILPVHLIQLRTRGGWHNQTPLKQFKQFEDSDGATRKIGTFRFYMDGLIIHIDDDTDDPIHWRYKGIALGESADQVVLSMPFENSFQKDLIDGHMLATLSDIEHAGVVDRIFGRSTIR